ncbi:MAG TPA: HU family DNA-binding protein [Desulfatiglandales bacterium]|nr:HU family DNA-binding protein [Desulfatiglandales bacterium]
MNKGELIEAVAMDVSVSKTVAGKVLDSTIDAMMGALGKGDRITLVGFGTFSVSTRKARSGRNPKTGEPIKIPASKTVKFKPGSAFKQAVK